MTTTDENVDWYLTIIAEADSIERLKFIAINIDYDKWEDEPYTKDENTMDILRKAYGKRAKELGE